jgi:DNA-binding winged helix-turn-helix (wHTH) protein
MRFAFGDLVLDVDTRQLLRAGRVVPLGPKGFALLLLLLRARPKAVSRTTLVAALWPDTHVGGTSLHVLVSQVRSALGDDPREPRWLRTVSHFGYAFSGEVHTDAGPAPVGEGGTRTGLAGANGYFPLAAGENLLGREDGLAVTVDGPGVSRRHARIVLGEAGATLEDLDSKNGTFLGGARVVTPRPLRDGDEVRLGARVTLVFRHLPEADTETERD